LIRRSICRVNVFLPVISDTYSKPTNILGKINPHHLDLEVAFRRVQRLLITKKTKVMLPHILYDLKSILISLSLDLMVALIVIERFRAVNLLKSVMKLVLLLFNILILLFCYSLTRIDLSIGAGLGLFALLGILRIRSEIIRIEELIGLLLLMGVGFIHSIYPQVLHIGEILLADVILVGISFFLGSCKSETICVKVKVENLALLHPTRRNDLAKIIEKNLGLAMKKVTILSINIEDGTASLHVTLDDTITQTDEYLNERPKIPLVGIIKALPGNGIKRDFNT
jgi:hypothetical protein